MVDLGPTVVDPGSIMVDHGRPWIDYVRPLVDHGRLGRPWIGPGQLAGGRAAAAGGGCGRANPGSSGPPGSPQASRLARLRCTRKQLPDLGSAKEHTASKGQDRKMRVS